MDIVGARGVVYASLGDVHTAYSSIAPGCFAFLLRNQVGIRTDAAGWGPGAGFLMVSKLFAIMPLGGSVIQTGFLYSALAVEQEQSEMATRLYLAWEQHNNGPETPPSDVHCAV